MVAGILFLLAALAGWIAAKAMKAGSPPAPQMAIEEAKLIKETISDPSAAAEAQRADADRIHAERLR